MHTKIKIGDTIATVTAAQAVTVNKAIRELYTMDPAYARMVLRSLLVWLLGVGAANSPMQCVNKLVSTDTNLYNCNCE